MDNKEGKIDHNLKVLRKLSSSIIYLGIFNISMFFVAFYIFFNFLDDLTGMFPLWISNLGIFLLLYFVLDLIININFIALSNVLIKQYRLFIFSILLVIYSYIFRYSLASSFFETTIVKLDSYAIYGACSTILYGLVFQEISSNLDNIGEITGLDKIGKIHLMTGFGLTLYLLPLGQVPTVFLPIIYAAGLSKIFLLPLVTTIYCLGSGNKLRKRANKLDDSIPVLEKYTII